MFRDNRSKILNFFERRMKEFFGKKYDVSYVANGGYTTSEISLNRVHAENVKVVLLSLVFASTLVLCILFFGHLKLEFGKGPLIAARYYFRLKYYQARGEMRYDETIYHYPHVIILILEVLLASIHPSPWLTGNFMEIFRIK